MKSLLERRETVGMLIDTPSLVLPHQAWLFNITDFYHCDLMPPQKFLHTPQSGAPQKCVQSGPALAKVGPVFNISLLSAWLV